MKTVIGRNAALSDVRIGNRVEEMLLRFTNRKRVNTTLTKTAMIRVFQL